MPSPTLARVVMSNPPLNLSWLLSNYGPGAWLEPRQGSMWQENTGITDTTSGGQTIGLLLGLEQPQLGPELVTNGTFTTDAAGWTVRNNGTATVSGGECTVASAEPFIAGGLAQTLSLQVGALYRVTGRQKRTTADSVQIAVLNNAGTALVSAGQPTTSTEFVSADYTFIATETNSLIYLRVATTTYASTYAGVFDSISVKKVLACYASQATAENRPTLQFNGDLPLIRYGATAALTAALPDLGGGAFSSAGSVYYVTGSEVTALHDQAIGTSYNLPGTGMDVYCYVVTPSRLVPPLESKLNRYLKRLAGLV